MSILFTNIIIMGILLMTLPLNKRKLRSSKLVLYIKLIIYVKFKQLSSYPYIYNNKKSFNKTQIYSNIFGVIIVDNKTIRIVENIFFK